MKCLHNKFGKKKIAKNQTKQIKTAYTLGFLNSAGGVNKSSAIFVMLDVDDDGDGKTGLRFGAKNFTVLGDNGFELNNVCLDNSGDVAIGDDTGDGDRSSLLRNSVNCCIAMKLLTYDGSLLCSLLTGLGGGVKTAPSGRRLVLITSLRKIFVSRLFKSYTRVVSESSLNVRLSFCVDGVTLVFLDDDTLLTIVLDESSVDIDFESESSMKTGLAVKISIDSDANGWEMLSINCVEFVMNFCYNFK